MWTHILLWILLAFALLEDAMPGEDIALKPESRNMKRQKLLEADEKEWRKSWEKTMKLKRQKLTKEQERYWRKLSEFPEDENENEEDAISLDVGKRSLPLDGAKDIRILSRKKRTGPLIRRPSRVRREWRQMTLAQKQSFINAFNSIASFVPDPVQDPDTTVFNIFVRWHRGRSAPGAHGGASFLPWHREFLWRMSNALRLQGYGGNLDLPYFDPALDQLLPDPKDSAIWLEHPEGIGINFGELGAPFNASVTTQISECSEGSTVSRSPRNPENAKERLYTREKYGIVMSKECFDHLTFGVDEDMERFHNRIHIFVGGTMGNAGCSPGDPVFWLHHTNVDCLWEEYRRRRQDPATRTLEYPLQDLGRRPQFRAWNSLMRPFDDWGMQNIHGLSNHYTNYYYRCRRRPSAINCDSTRNCVPRNVDNPMLWCWTDERICVSKIREGGVCNTTWPHEQCFCINEDDTPRCNAAAVCRCN